MQSIDNWVESSYHSSSSSSLETGHHSLIDSNLIPYLVCIQKLDKINANTSVVTLIATLEKSGTGVRKTLIKLKTEFNRYKEMLFQRVGRSDFFDLIRLSDIFGGLWVDSTVSFPLLEAIQYIYQRGIVVIDEKKQSKKIVQGKELKDLVDLGKLYYEQVKGIVEQNKKYENLLIELETSFEPIIRQSLKILKELTFTLMGMNFEQKSSQSGYKKLLKTSLIDMLKTLIRKLKEQDKQTVLDIELQIAEDSYETNIKIWKGDACITSKKLYSELLTGRLTENMLKSCSKIVRSEFKKIIIPIINEDIPLSRLKHLNKLLLQVDKSIKEDIDILSNIDSSSSSSGPSEFLYKKALQVDKSICMKYFLKQTTNKNYIDVCYEFISKLESNTIKYPPLVANELFELELSIPTPSNADCISSVDSHIEAIENLLKETYEFLKSDIHEKIQSIPVFTEQNKYVDTTGLKEEGKVVDFNIFWKEIIDDLLNIDKQTSQYKVL